jgi:hypothetical protein
MSIINNFLHCKFNGSGFVTKCYLKQDMPIYPFILTGINVRLIVKLYETNAPLSAGTGPSVMHAEHGVQHVHQVYSVQ